MTSCSNVASRFGEAILLHRVIARSREAATKQSPLCRLNEIASGWVSIRPRKALVLLNHQPSH